MSTEGSRKCDLHNEAHIHEATKNYLGITQDTQDIVQGDLSFGRVPSKIGLQSCLDVSSFILIQPLSRLRAEYLERLSVT